MRRSTAPPPPTCCLFLCVIPFLKKISFDDSQTPHTHRTQFFRHPTPTPVPQPHTLHGSPPPHPLSSPNRHDPPVIIHPSKAAPSAKSGVVFPPPPSVILCSFYTMPPHKKNRQIAPQHTEAHHTEGKTPAYSLPLSPLSTPSCDTTAVLPMFVPHCYYSSVDVIFLIKKKSDQTLTLKKIQRLFLPFLLHTGSCVR